MVLEESSLPSTKSEALSLGVSRFLTGMPCANGHISPRRASDGKCVCCVSARKNKYRATPKGKDSHDNGKRDGTRTARKKCASYIDGVLEKDDYTSLTDAAEYLKSKGYSKASYKHIGQALSGDRKSAYGRMWQKIV